MAKEIRQRPSKLLGVKDPYAAYCLDEAILVGINLIQADLETITHDKAKVQARKRDQRLRQLLGLSTKASSGFRDPFAK